MAKKKHRSYLFQEMECRVTGLTTRGWGQGRIRVCEENEPRAAEIRGGLPGDLVKAQIRRIENGILQCEAVEILEPGETRIPERCRHCQRRKDLDTGCGGCTLQSLDYAQQLKLKTGIVKNALDLNEIGDIEIKPIIPAPNPWEYRNKMEFSFGPHGESELGCGLHPSGFKFEVIEQAECFLVTPDFVEITKAVLAWAREMGLEYFAFRRNEGFLRLLSIREGRRSGERMVILTTSGDERVKTVHGLLPARAMVQQFLAIVESEARHLGIHLSSVYWTRWHSVEGQKSWLEDILLAGEPVLHEHLFLPFANQTLDFDILPHAFYQPNSLQAETLYNQILLLAEPYLSADTPVLDLYCGTGTIALCFALKGHRSVGIDIEKQAIENARANAVQNKLDNVKFYAGDCAEVLGNLSSSGELKEHFIVIDPPRRGLLSGAYKQVMKLAPKAFIYVSCNPFSLADDLKKFRNDGFTVKFIQPVDMLPQTAHVECICLLERAAN